MNNTNLIKQLIFYYHCYPDHLFVSIGLKFLSIPMKMRLVNIKLLSC
jgi:hypothetical protein